MSPQPAAALPFPLSTGELSDGILAVALMAAAGPPAAAQAPLPTGYRQMIAEQVKQTFFDPYSIRDAAISAPAYDTAFFDGRTPIPWSVWSVCVRANAKNRMGAYTGSNFTRYVFRGGKFESHDSGGSKHFCAEAAGYQPFPEIEEGARQPSRR